MRTLRAALRTPGRHDLNRKLMLLVAGIFAGGVLLLAGYAWQQRSATVFAVGTLVALAASAVGVLAGFLFGLPRYVPAAGAATVAELRAGTYTPGNNLEQVADWLTKLLLGAGLTQLGRFGGWFGAFTAALGGALVGPGGSDPSGARVLAGSVIVLYPALGFLFGYVLTTLWYLRNLSEGEEETPEQAVR
ncbi:hypothetical protein [Micromonospora mirobrigensis]|uniref:Uncharacterized protein n=1 Tax=Micromonospora mirobrigensis TaxID=262898 RepID=A0A1C4UXE8_9ACTN|nr:hypothetical protein [Micromonospora mirobrigensis]SCE76315.1 hypothetical protein GA0070564_101785 [Micromonospora mirobrigensis]